MYADVLKVVLIILAIIAIVVLAIYTKKLKTSEIRSSSIISTCGTMLTLLIAIITLLYGFTSFTQEQRYSMKVDAYTKALAVVDQFVLAQDLANPPDLSKGITATTTYWGTKCGVEPTQEEENEVYTELALVSPDPSIPSKYLEIILSTTSPLVLERNDFINTIRKDIGYGNISPINDGYTLITNSSCENSGQKTFAKEV